METKEIAVQFEVDEKHKIDGLLTIPPKTSTWKEFAVVMTHGAGGDMNTQQLAELANKVATAGLTAFRFTCKTPNFSYRVRCFAAAVKYIKHHSEYKVRSCIIGGRSMGGRVAAELATNYTTEDDFIWGVFCLSYPLHRPKRFNELRVAHVIHLNLPVLFVSGTNDAMCRMDLMEDTIDKIKNDVKVHWVQDADHSLNVKGKFDHGILDKICHWTLEWSQSVFMAER